MIIRVFRENELAPIATINSYPDGWLWLTQFGPMGFGACPDLQTAFANLNQFTKEHPVP